MPESEPYDSPNTPSQASYDLERAAKISDYNEVSGFSNPSTVTINRVLGHVFRRPYLSVPIAILTCGVFVFTGVVYNRTVGQYLAVQLHKSYVDNVHLNGKYQ